MGGTRRWPYGSTARVRALVLLALGVVKVATASQLRQLVLPGTADAQTVRNACKDLRHAGLVESVGSTSRPGKSGQPVTEQLWNLTTVGLAAAATELDRPLREMGGTARDAAKAGAAHALKVTDTIDAFRQSEPLPTKPVTRTKPAAAVPAQLVASAVTRPQGLGKLRGWTTEVALPVAGTFTAPGRGSLRADAVLTAPEDGVPVLFVEVDNHTEPPAQVADKIARYRRFSCAPRRTTAAARCRCGRRCGRTPDAAAFRRSRSCSPSRSGRASCRSASVRWAACPRTIGEAGGTPTTPAARASGTDTATTTAQCRCSPPPWRCWPTRAPAGRCGGATATTRSRRWTRPSTTPTTTAPTSCAPNSAAPPARPTKTPANSSGRRSAAHGGVEVAVPVLRQRRLPGPGGRPGAGQQRMLPVPQPPRTPRTGGTGAGRS